MVFCFRTVVAPWVCPYINVTGIQINIRASNIQIYEYTILSIWLKNQMDICKYEVRPDPPWIWSDSLIWTSRNFEYLVVIGIKLFVIYLKTAYFYPYLLLLDMDWRFYSIQYRWIQNLENVIVTTDKGERVPAADPRLSQAGPAEPRAGGGPRHGGGREAGGRHEAAGGASHRRHQPRGLPLLPQVPHTTAQTTQQASSRQITIEYASQL